MAHTKSPVSVTGPRGLCFEDVERWQRHEEWHEEWHQATGNPGFSGAEAGGFNQAYLVAPGGEFPALVALDHDPTS